MNTVSRPIRNSQFESDQAILSADNG